MGPSTWGHQALSYTHVELGFGVPTPATLPSLAGWCLSAEGGAEVRVWRGAVSAPVLTLHLETGGEQTGL